MRKVQKSYQQVGETYFSLDRKVTKRSRLNRLHRLGLSKEAVLPLRMADTGTYRTKTFGFNR